MERNYFGGLFWKKVLLEFARTFIPFFILGLAGAWDSFVTGDLESGKAAVVALITGGIAAGLRAIQALFTNFETPPS
jgi:hypothetical protein